MNKKEGGLEKAIHELTDEMERCRKTYVVLWIRLSLGLLIILTHMAGFW